MKTTRKTICLHNLLLLLITIAMKTTGVVGGGGDGDCKAERKVANKCLDDKWLGVSSRTSQMTDVTCCRAIESLCVDFKFQLICTKTTVSPSAEYYQGTYEACKDANINPTAEFCRKLRPTADNCKKYLPCNPDDKILVAEGGEADGSGSGGGGGGNGSQTPAGTQTQGSQKPNGAAARLPKLVPQSVSTLLLSVLLAGAVVFKWFCDDN